MKLTVIIWLLTVFIMRPVLAFSTAAPEQQKITFVCEHGAAKSVIAALYFNKIAQERGLPYTAVARGMSPEATLQDATQAGLLKDRMDLHGMTPTPMSVVDANASFRVVAIDIDNEPGYLTTEKLVEWKAVPAVSKNYELARDDIVKRIERLLSALSATEK